MKNIDCRKKNLINYIERVKGECYQIVDEKVDKNEMFLYVIVLREIFNYFYSRLNCFEKIDSETKKRRFIECVKKCLDIVYHFVCEDDFDSLFIIYNSICLDTDSHNNVDLLSGSNLNCFLPPQKENMSA